MSKYPIHDKIVDMFDDEKYLLAYPDIYTEQLKYDIGSLLAGYEKDNPSFQVSLQSVEYPAVSGGTAFLAFIENGNLITFTWDYDFEKRGDVINNVYSI